MEHALYDKCMEELRAQLQVDLLLPAAAPPAKDAFAQYSATYLRYLSIYTRLEVVYEALSGAQARHELGEVLSLVLVRILTCRGLAAKWHPMPPDVVAALKEKGTPNAPLPGWECLEWGAAAAPLPLVGGGGGGGEGRAPPLLLPEALEVHPPAQFFDALRAVPPAPLAHYFTAGGGGGGGGGLGGGGALTGRAVVAPTLRFLESSSALRGARDALVTSMNQLKLGVPEVAVEVDALALAAAGRAAPQLQLSPEDAVQLILRFERGRASVARVAALRKKRAWEAAQLAKARARFRGGGGGGGGEIPSAEGSSAEEAGLENLPEGAGGTDEEGAGGGGGEGVDDDGLVTPDAAATQIQRIVRGKLARGLARRMRVAESAFLGMRPSAAARKRLGALEEGSSGLAAAVKERAAAGAATLPGGLAAAAKALEREAGPDIRDELRMARTRWLQREMAEKGAVPEALGEPEGAAGEGMPATGFYLPPPAPAEGGAAAVAAPPPATNGAAAAPGDAPPAAPTPLRVTTEPGTWGGALHRLLERHRTLWSGGRGACWNEGEARAIVGGAVRASLVPAVDASMNEIIANLKTAQAKKTKPAKKPKPKKPKKVKASAGEKWWEKRLEKRRPVPEDYLGFLAEARALNRPAPGATFASFLGAACLTGPEIWASTDAMRYRQERINAPGAPPRIKPGARVWFPPEPTYGQVREAVMALGALPLGCPSLLEELDREAAAHKLWRGCAPRSLLLYGSRGVGKTHLAQAVAAACGALFINLSVSNVEGKFLDKDGPAGALQAAFALAKDPAFAPVVIYVDEVEKMLLGGKAKRAPRAAPRRPTASKRCCRAT